MAAARFFLLLFQNAYRIFCQRKGTVGVFCFQGCFGNHSVNSHHLPFNPEVTPFQINVFPLEAEEFSPSQPGGQLQVVELKDATFPGFPQK